MCVCVCVHSCNSVCSTGARDRGGALLGVHCACRTEHCTSHSSHWSAACLNMGKGKDKNLGMYK